MYGVVCFVYKQSDVNLEHVRAEWKQTYLAERDSRLAAVATTPTTSCRSYALPLAYRAYVITDYTTQNQLWRRKLCRLVASTVYIYSIYRPHTGVTRMTNTHDAYNHLDTSRHPLTVHV